MRVCIQVHAEFENAVVRPLAIAGAQTFVGFWFALDETSVAAVFWRQERDVFGTQFGRIK